MQRLIGNTPNINIPVTRYPDLPVKNLFSSPMTDEISPVQQSGFSWKAKEVENKPAVELQVLCIQGFKDQRECLKYPLFKGPGWPHPVLFYKELKGEISQGYKDRTDYYITRFLPDSKQ